MVKKAFVLVEWLLMAAAVLLAIVAMTVSLICMGPLLLLARGLHKLEDWRR